MGGKEFPKYVAIARRTGTPLIKISETSENADYKWDNREHSFIVTADYSEGVLAIIDTLLRNLKGSHLVEITEEQYHKTRYQMNLRGFANGRRVP